MSQSRGVFLTPKLYVLIVLAILTLISMSNFRDLVSQLLTVCICMGTAIVFDVLVGIIQERNKLMPDGAMVTGLIIALVLGAATHWYVCAITTLLALVSKHILKSKRKPIFNPAAFGLLGAILIFSSMQSWWGSLSLLPNWCVLFLLIGGYFVTNRVNKFPQVFAFLGSYFLLQLIFGWFHIGDATDAVRTPFVNSALFLAFFMLTDPPTSPGKYKDQILFGILAASIGCIIFVIWGGLAYLLIGLLVANVWSFIRSSKRTKPSYR